MTGITSHNHEKNEMKENTNKSFECNQYIFTIKNTGNPLAQLNKT